MDRDSRVGLADEAGGVAIDLAGGALICRAPRPQENFKMVALGQKLKFSKGGGLLKAQKWQLYPK